MTNANPVIDAQRLSLVLNALRLPAITLVWPEFAARADKEGWPAARLLAALAEHATAAASNGTSARRACRPARPSTASPSTPSP